MRLRHVPETNSFGIVLPPSAEELAYLRLFQKPTTRPDTVDRHHLYWPKSLYKSDISKEFRAHRFNSIWVLRKDHDAIHRRFDGVPVPSRDVMHRFVEEAKLLDRLGVSVKNVEIKDAVLRDGQASDPGLIELEKERNEEVIRATMGQLDRFQVIPYQIAKMIISQQLEFRVAT